MFQALRAFDLIPWSFEEKLPASRRSGNPSPEIVRYRAPGRLEPASGRLLIKSLAAIVRDFLQAYAGSCIKHT
jgi:hypothetical protein